MSGVQGVALAASTSETGGLGSLPCARLDLDALRDQITALRARTCNPFNVNFFCHSPPAYDDRREAGWRAALAPYYAELGLESTVGPSEPGPIPFDDDAADVVAPFRPAVVSFHFGLPSFPLLTRVRGWGTKILACATTVDEARWLVSHGVDAIIAQGLEAGGHRGNFLSPDLATQMGTFALLPQIVRAVPLPVVAAGGIADARGVAAAFALGAAGVQVGTKYLLCPETTTTEIHRAALTDSERSVTALTNLFTGRPARGIMNRLMKELGPLSALAPEFPLASAAIAPLREAAERLGRDDFTPLWAGQNVSGCRAVPAAVLTSELADGVPAAAMA
jgi:nitronate monooxygenase